MGNKDTTIAYIRDEVETCGFCVITRAVAKAILGDSYPVDADYEAAIDALAGSRNWITVVRIQWNEDTVRIEGPIVLPPPPDW